MGRRRRGGRRAAPVARFEVASVLEDLCRDVEALWYVRGGPDDTDWDRCDRHAMCDAARFDDWDRYSNPGCRGTCAFCDPVRARGCKACAQRARRSLIRLRRDFQSDASGLLADIADQRRQEKECGMQPFRLASLCSLAPLPPCEVRCRCECCRLPERNEEGCSEHCCRRHGDRVALQRDVAKYATASAAGVQLQAELDAEDVARRGSVRQRIEGELCADCGPSKRPMLQYDASFYVDPYGVYDNRDDEIAACLEMQEDWSGCIF